MLFHKEECVELFDSFRESKIVAMIRDYLYVIMRYKIVRLTIICNGLK